MKTYSLLSYYMWTDGQTEKHVHANKNSFNFSFRTRQEKFTLHLLALYNVFWHFRVHNSASSVSVHEFALTTRARRACNILNTSSLYQMCTDYYMGQQHSLLLYKLYSFRVNSVKGQAGLQWSGLRCSLHKYLRSFTPSNGSSTI
jgi:hypothetical protein